MCERVSYSVIYLLYHRLHDNDRDDGVNFLSLSLSLCLFFKKTNNRPTASLVRFHMGSS